MWNLPPPPDFQGLHPDKPLRIYQRHLPHWRQEGATYFATFRLNDSLPQTKLHELKRIREEFYIRYPPPQTDEALEELAREITFRIERWLDHGYGSCVLRQPQHAAQLVDTMHHFDVGRPDSSIVPRYELDCYVVMANHVHAIVRPLFDELHPLEDILGGWKQYSSKNINAAQGTKGPLWLDESFDRLIRDEEHLWKAIQYIGNNPDRAGVPRAQCPLWIRPEWESLGWKFEFNRTSKK